MFWCYPEAFTPFLQMDFWSSNLSQFYASHGPVSLWGILVVNASLNQSLRGTEWERIYLFYKMLFILWHYLSHVKDFEHGPVRRRSSNLIAYLNEWLFGSGMHPSWLTTNWLTVAETHEDVFLSLKFVKKPCKVKKLPSGIQGFLSSWSAILGCLWASWKQESCTSNTALYCRPKKRKERRKYHRVSAYILSAQVSQITSGGRVG